MNITTLSWLVLIAALIAFAWSYFSAGQPAVCHGMGNSGASLEFIDHENDAKFHYDRTIKQLVMLRKNNSDKAVELSISDDILGLTLGEYKYSVNFALGFQKPNFWEDAYCPSIQKMAVEFIYDSNIYIAQEHTHNKCAFDVVMGHELDHHQINVTNKRRYLAWLKEDLPAILDSMMGEYDKPVRKNEMTLLRDRVLADINKVLSTYISSMNRDMKSENQKIDTMDEYRRLNNKIRTCYSAVR